MVKVDWSDEARRAAVVAYYGLGSDETLAKEAMGAALNAALEQMVMEGKATIGESFEPDGTVKPILIIKTEAD